MREDTVDGTSEGTTVGIVDGGAESPAKSSPNRKMEGYLKEMVIIKVRSILVLIVEVKIMMSPTSLGSIDVDCPLLMGGLPKDWRETTNV